MIDYVFKVAGEEEPFLYCTKATYQRLGEVIVRYGVKVLSSLSFSEIKDRNTSFILLLEIPQEHISQVGLHLRTTLSEPTQVQLPYSK